MIEKMGRAGSKQKEHEERERAIANSIQNIKCSFVNNKENKRILLPIAERSVIFSSSLQRRERLSFHFLYTESMPCSFLIKFNLVIL